MTFDTSFERSHSPNTTINDDDKATAKRIIKRYLDNDTNDHQFENEFIAALTTVRKEAREAAFKEAVVIINEQTSARKAIKAIEAVANDEGRSRRE